MKQAIRIESHENKQQFDCALHRVPLKTKNENEMKTKNNVQKAILRSAAVVVSFVLISFTVSAQTFWKRLLENTGFSDIAIAMAAPADDKDLNETNASATAAYFFASEAEPSLELEAWMTDDSRFATNHFNYNEAIETSLDLEEWMMNEMLFQPLTDKEEAMELESWMISDKTWEI